MAAFVEFLAGYGPLVFRRRTVGDWTLPQFSLQSVTEILGASPGCRVIVEDPGFGAVAAAVRSATFGAQGNRHQGAATHREIRYGLLADIYRSGLVGKRDLQNLIYSFVASFNQESARRRQAGLPASGIKAAEVDGFSRSMDRAPSSHLAGALLCGVASCHSRDVRHSEPEAEMVQTSISV